MSSSIPPFEKLNGHNYEIWALRVMDHLKQLGLWRIVEGDERKPLPPAGPRLSGPDPTNQEEGFFKPTSQDPVYLQRFDQFQLEWERYQNNVARACGVICMAMESLIRYRYQENIHNDPKALWACIKKDFAPNRENTLDVFDEMQKLVTCKLENHRTVADWIEAQDRIVENLAKSSVDVEKWRNFYLLWNLPKTRLWRSFKASLGHNALRMSSASLIAEITTSEDANWRNRDTRDYRDIRGHRDFRDNRNRGGHPDNRNHEKSFGAGPNSNSSKPLGTRTASKPNPSSWLCFGCGERGHKRAFCRNRDIWSLASGGMDNRSDSQNPADQKTPKDIRDEMQNSESDLSGEYDNSDYGSDEESDDDDSDI